jgi:hypothetical protein
MRFTTKLHTLVIATTGRRGSGWLSAGGAAGPLWAQVVKLVLKLLFIMYWAVNITYITTRPLKNS